MAIGDIYGVERDQQKSMYTVHTVYQCRDEAFAYRTNIDFIEPVLVYTLGAAVHCLCVIFLLCMRCVHSVDLFVLPYSDDKSAAAYCSGAH